MRIPDPYPTPVQPEADPSWSPSVRESYVYDRVEVWGDRRNPGYTAAYLNCRQATIAALQAACPAPARVLDLAAAQGNFSIALAALGYRVTWNDLRPELIDYVRMKLPRGTDLEFVAGNVFELGAQHVGAYDVVLATEVIEHVAHPDRFLVSLAGLVRPGGSIVISTPNGGYVLNTLPRFSDHPDPAVFESVQFKPNSDGHIFLLHEDEIHRLAADAGLEVRQLQLLTTPLTAGHMKLRHLHKLLPPHVIAAMEGATGLLPASLRRWLSTQIVAVLAKSPAAPAAAPH